MRHASLFSGIGGPEIAATMLGWDNLFHCEINPFGRRVLEYWYPKSVSYKDVTKTDFKEWRGKIDVLSGGFPCQPFSVAGKRQGYNDDRYLWPEMLRVIDEIRPTWVVGENVAGITSMVQSARIVELENQTSLFEEHNGLYRHRYVGIFTLEKICKDLESLQYEVQPVIIPACAVGAPHRRDRIFIIGRIAVDTNSCYDVRSSQQKDITCKAKGLQERNKIRELGKSVDIRPRCKSDVDANANSCINISPGESESSARDKTNITSAKGCRGARGKRFDRFSQFSRNKAGSWERFPSVPAFYRGNDGIPFDVDSLAISFGKWRTESIKAYGNAIVPQVIFEIFRCIDIIENER